MRLLTCTALLTLLLQVCSDGSALANPCDGAALRAAAEQDIPPQIMRAITRVETGQSRDGTWQPWPWTINQQGDGRWFDTREEAIAFADAAIRDGVTNMDIGCFQLNLRWHAENFGSLEEMFDPEANAAYAARFLNQNYAESGNWVDAVAAYHSATPELAAAYVEKVEAVLLALGPEPEGEFLAPTVVSALPRVNRFPLLQPGAAAAMASLVPAIQDAQPLFAVAP